MLCKNPYMKGVIPCGCGQCIPCRINKRREWTNRLLLEQIGQKNASFVTLTYRDEELSDYSGEDWRATRPVIPTLVKCDLQKFIKRLRKRVSPIRFYGVGEYGDISERPHYHVAVFGLPVCMAHPDRCTINNRKKPENYCEPCTIVSEAWDSGRVDVAELTKDSAAYIAGYVTKKWTKEDKWTREKLRGRQPEFCRMSLKPGIGAIAIKNLVTSTVQNQRKAEYLIKSSSAPVVLKNGGSTLPLGRYLRRKWREALGRSGDCPEQELQGYIREMQSLYEEAKNGATSAGKPESFKDAKGLYLERVQGKIESMVKRAKIYEQGKIL